MKREEGETFRGIRLGSEGQRLGFGRKRRKNFKEATGWLGRRGSERSKGGGREVEGRENGIRRSSRRGNRRREIAENFLLKVEPGLVNQFCTSLYFDESQHPLEGILLAASSTTLREEDLC